jgi:IS30 family transposase
VAVGGVQPNRWLAKSTDLSTYSHTDLDAIARRINHMPRRSLNWGHAHRHYYDALVALTP